MSSSAPDIVNRYFAALNSRDGESLLGLFTRDAVVSTRARPGVVRARSVRGSMMSCSDLSTLLGCSALRAPVTASMSPARASRGTFRAG